MNQSCVESSGTANVNKERMTIAMREKLEFWDIQIPFFKGVVHPQGSPYDIAPFYIGNYSPSLLKMERFLKVVSSLIPQTHTVACSGMHAPCSSIHDQEFGISVPALIKQQSMEMKLVGLARRCMHDICWFSPARAYILGIYVDPAVLNRASVSSGNAANLVSAIEVPKAFVLYFASRKDSRHVKNGFERSYLKFAAEHFPQHPDRQRIDSFLSLFRQRDFVHPNDAINIHVVPGKDLARVSINEEPEIEIQNAQDLIKWLHWLYLGTETRPVARYPTMQRELFADFENTQRYREILEA